MELSKPSTQANIEAAIDGESTAKRKYLFFADVAKKLGRSDLVKLFRDTAAQETEAVAKDRAIEALMQVGDRFVLSILRDDNHQQLTRHFLKRFPHGAHRFARVNSLEHEAKGEPVPGDALAYLACRFEQRLEGPDLWVIYAEVEQGNVADANATTAVHHRKVGNHY